MTAPLTMDAAATELGVSRRWLQEFLQTIEPCHLQAGHRKLFDGIAMSTIRHKMEVAKARAPVSNEAANNEALATTQAEQRQRAFPSTRHKPVKFVGGIHSDVVYFIKSGRHVKIGTTKKLDQRLASLESHSPSLLRVCLLLDGGKKLEQELHREFAAYRYRGEWFRLTAAVKGFILRYGGSLS